jgi:alpha-L-rhamnosidase
LADPTSDKSHASITETDDGVDVDFYLPPGYVVLDLGRTVHGRLSAEVAGPPGSIVDIGWDERIRTEAQRPLPYMGSLYPEWSQVDSWILDGEARQIRTIDARAGRFIVIAVWGQGPIELDHIRVFEEHYPVTQVGDFHCSDPLLNEIWQVGIDSLLPNMTDAYTDTPWRERGQWWGDAYVEEHINRIAFGDTLLIRRGINLVASDLTRYSSPAMVPNNNFLHMLDYTMLWVLNLAEYVQQTQDLSVLETTYPLLIQFLDHLETFENPETHLLDLPQKSWGETAYIDSGGFHSRYGQSTALNALYYGTLQAAAEIAIQKGASDAAHNWREKANQVKISANALLYLPREHRYLSTVFNGEAVDPTPHAQAWPVVYGLAPEGENDQVVASLLELLSPGPANSTIQVYGMFWVLEALGQTGHIPQALDIIKLYYGYMLERGATTWWENFVADQRTQDSTSHGWGGSPSWFLSSYVLGLRESEPNTWIAKPALDSIDFASGALPLQNGTLQIQWEHKECDATHIQIVSDQASHGAILLPFADPSLAITLDNEVIWQSGKPLTEQAEREIDNIRIVLDGGNHNLLVSQACQTAEHSP